MAINKNFVVKNGLEVNTDLIFADATAVKVGIATTNPQYTLDVYGILKSNHLNVIGVATATGGFVGDLTGDVTGNLTGNLIGNATGNSDTATSLETPRNIGGVLFDGTADIDLPGVNIIGNQDIAANADTATSLETPRNIGGVLFDGTADIDLPGVNTTGNQNITGTAANLSGTPDISINDLTASGNVSISGDLSVTGSLAYDQAIADNLEVTGISTFSNVKISSGIITATSTQSPVVYYGDGTHLTNVQRGVGFSIQQTSLVDDLTLLGSGVKNITLEGAGISTCTVDPATDTATVHITGSGAFVTVSDTKPPSDGQRLGDLWYNNNVGKLYVWYDESKIGLGTAAYWVDAAPFDSATLQGDVDVTGSITATSFIGDGSNLTGTDLVDDTTPELGGNLNLNSKDIIGTGNINIAGNINNINAVGVSTFNGGLITTEFAEKVNAIGNGGTDMLIDLSNGTHVTATLSEPSTNITFNTGISSDSIGFTLVLTNGADDQSIVWPMKQDGITPMIKWPANNLPSRTTASGKTDIWVFVSSDGGANWYGNVAIYNFT